MQRLFGSVLVVLAVALSAGGVSQSVRADGHAGAAAAQAPDQCAVPTYPPVRINARAAEMAEREDIVPLNTRGYNYNADDDQWRPEQGAPPAPAPAAPAKP